MARPSCTGGVTAVGCYGIRFDFTVNGERFRLVKHIVPTEENLMRARQYLAWIQMQIDSGTFDLAKEFPEYAARRGARVLACALSCAQLFDAFLRHEEAQVLRQELTQATVDGHRRILNGGWRPHIGHMLFTHVTATLLDEVADTQDWSKKTYNNAIGALKSAFAYVSRDFPERQNPAAALKYARIPKPRVDPFSVHDAEQFILALHVDWGEAEGNFHELRFFTGLRPCEEIALRVTDYDRTRGTLNINKTRVRGRERLATKNNKNRTVELCPRAIAVLERHLQLRAQFVARGLIEHDALFFTDSGAPMRHLAVTSRRWTRTLKRLSIRYRRPYVARHTSVSWNLMIGLPAQRVAQQHGHSDITMLTVYSAWTQGAPLQEIEAIRRARDACVSYVPRGSHLSALAVTPHSVSPSITP